MPVEGMPGPVRLAALWALYLVEHAIEWFVRRVAP